MSMTLQARVPRACYYFGTTYDAVRILLCIVLLSTALLKVGHNVAGPLVETSRLTSRWFLLILAPFYDWK